MINQATMVEDAYPLVAIEARRFRQLPSGVSVDDLESLGGECLIAAAAEYGGPSDGWKRFAKFYVRNRMRSFCQQARKRSARHTTLEVQVREGGELTEFPREDKRCSDPAEIALARERFVARPKSSPPLPDPADVAERVTLLRSAMFGAIDPGRVRVVMEKLQQQAESGDLKAVKLLIDLLAPGRSGVTVQQQAVVIHQGDLS